MKYDGSLIFSRFAVDATPVAYEQCNIGHINGTYFVTCDNGKKYVLQKINTHVFTDPESLMHNFVSVTQFLKKKVIAAGGDPEREALGVIPARDGQYFVRDGEEYWRLLVYITNATSYQSAENPVLFANAAYAFGKFQRLLSDFPASTLVETIPNFHNTVSRYNDLLAAIERDAAGRAATVAREIEFIKARRDKCSFIVDRIASGEFPLRVTHNDTKLNNIMIDNDTLEGICVIDLDTVMPGAVHNDFGDAIRFGASNAAENERDLDLVYVRLDLYETYVEGFLRGLDNSLSEAEVRTLPMGAYVLTLEQGIRFLTDYLDGDTYFAVHREGENLDRARTQLKLVYDTESKFDQLNALIDKYI